MKYVKLSPYTKQAMHAQQNADLTSCESTIKVKQTRITAVKS